MQPNRYIQAERLVGAVLQLARLNLKEGGAFVGLTLDQAFDAIDIEAAEILGRLIDQVEAEISILSGVRS